MSDYTRFQEFQGVWTKDLAKAVKTARGAVVRFSQVFATPSWHRDAKWVEFELYEDDRNGTEKRTSARFTGRIGNGHLDQTRPVGGELAGLGIVDYASGGDNLYAPCEGNWHFFLFPNQICHRSSVLRSIPAGATVKFAVLLDYRSTSNMAATGLHGDVLEIEIVKGKNRKIFQLDECVVPHNSARFGR